VLPDFKLADRADAHRLPPSELRPCGHKAICQGCKEDGGFAIDQRPSCCNAACRS